MSKYGAAITTFLAAAILFGLFNRIILDVNQVSFADSGDGLKSTFGTVYHIKHDSAYWHTGAMNYPFGESVFFTGNQVVLTNTLKLLKDAGWDLSDYALGISNFLILLSYVIAALFIYLIFREVGVGQWMAIPATLIIVLLSNQWERLGGHYNLAYAYVIPVILYLLLRFFRKPKLLISVIFGIVVVLFSAKQLYIAAFILILWLPFWVFIYFQDREKFGKPVFIITHVLIQFLLPFLLFNIFTGMHDPGLDRTAYPWGFYLSRIKLEAVFLPEGLPHGKFIDFKGAIRSKAYVGLLGTVVSLIILISVFTGLIRKKGIRALRVSENPAWNILFWAGVASLLVALGLPFAPDWERLLNYTGPFRQLRAVGRFVFPFYYIMTITSFLFLWKWYGKSRLKIKPILLALIILFSVYEAMAHIWKRPELYNNPISWHSGLSGQSEQNQWYSKLDFTQYQAILPLPYFHVGSENYWLGDHSPVMAQAYAASLGTGLPLTAVMLSRTSITQTLLNLDLVLEPYHEYPILDNFPDDRPLLLLRHKNAGLTAWERALVRKALPINENAELELYSLSLDSIRSLITDRQEELRSRLGDSTPQMSFLFEDFSSEADGVFRSEFTKATTLYEEIVPDTGMYKISFWFEGTDRDLWPRTVFWAELYGENGEKYHYMYTDFFRKMVLRDGPWGLVEFQLHVKEPGSKLKIAFKNRLIMKGEMLIDRVLVCPAESSHLMEDQGRIWVNNRQLISR